MRLWHYKLIPYLPDKQLRGQWRECHLIAKGLKEGTLNHCIVNRVKKYPIAHFLRYCEFVAAEMQRRGYKGGWFDILRMFESEDRIGAIKVQNDELFAGWHNLRYLIQCYFNLEEKYDCGAISEEEFMKVATGYERAVNENVFAIAQVRQLPKK